MIKFFRVSQQNFATQNQRSCLPEKAQSTTAGRPLVKIAPDSYRDGLNHNKSLTYD
ncbi:hypothetical protein [Rasiella sp. SM2506]|uniref:hypothetical protein n=1 Tax=Rasiella sp. SM2506 TaxID=3423914 RepID=UPI003D7A3A17